MPGSIRSMHLEYVLRDVQTDRGNLLHGRLLRWQFDTVTFGTQMPSGGVHPITRRSVQSYWNVTRISYFTTSVAALLTSRPAPAYMS